MGTRAIDRTDAPRAARRRIRTCAVLFAPSRTRSRFGWFAARAGDIARHAWTGRLTRARARRRSDISADLDGKSPVVLGVSGSRFRFAPTRTDP